jgi:hypothetical protein
MHLFPFQEFKPEILRMTQDWTIANKNWWISMCALHGLSPTARSQQAIFRPQNIDPLWQFPLYKKPKTTTQETKVTPPLYHQEPSSSSLLCYQQRGEETSFWWSGCWQCQVAPLEGLLCKKDKQNWKQNSVIVDCTVRVCWSNGLNDSNYLKKNTGEHAYMKKHAKCSCCAGGLFLLISDGQMIDAHAGLLDPFCWSAMAR